MAVATHFRFRLAVPLLAIVAMLASTRASADAMHSDPRACDIDQAKPRRSEPLKPRALPFEPARPVILDGVMYLQNWSTSGATGVQRAAATPRCVAHPDIWEFGVFHRRINPSRYY
jgi:hypothetical protein